MTASFVDTMHIYCSCNFCVTLLLVIRLCLLADVCRWFGEIVWSDVEFCQIASFNGHSCYSIWWTTSASADKFRVSDIYVLIKSNAVWCEVWHMSRGFMCRTDVPVTQVYLLHHFTCYTDLPMLTVESMHICSHREKSFLLWCYDIYVHINRSIYKPTAVPAAKIQSWSSAYKLQSMQYDA